MESYQDQVVQKQVKQRENRGAEKVQFRDAINIQIGRFFKNKIDDQIA